MGEGLRRAVKAARSTRKTTLDDFFVSGLQKTAFDEFWAIYWLKKCKKDAIRAYAALVRHTGLHRRIMDAVRDQTPEMLRRAPTMRPYAATWLRGCRWEDEALMAPKKPSEPPTETQQAEAEKIYREFLTTLTTEDREFLQGREYAD